MQKVTLALAFLLVTVTSIAQDKTVQQLRTESGKSITKDDKDTVVKTWKTGGMFNGVVGQTSLTNWALTSSIRPSEVPGGEPNSTRTFPSRNVGDRDVPTKGSATRPTSSSTPSRARAGPVRVTVRDATRS